MIMKALSKKVFRSSLIMLLALMLLAGCSGRTQPRSTNPVNNNSISKNNTSSKPSPKPTDSRKTLLSNMMNLAREGKVIDCEYPVKTTVIDDIEKKWGQPDKKDWVPAAKGTYVTYSKRHLAFGFNKGEQIFETRSSDSQLGKITLSLAKQVYGTPDHDVKSNGEEIMGYRAGEEYKMLLVFPQAAGKNTNPALDHYSVLYPKGTVNMMADDPGREW